jgi:hypothetical protein
VFGNIIHRDTFQTILAEKLIRLRNYVLSYFQFIFFIEHKTIETFINTYAPDISDISITYTSLCIPPGQVSFSGLSVGTYIINIQHEDYPDTSTKVEILENWKKEEIIISP